MRYLLVLSLLLPVLASPAQAGEPYVQTQEYVLASAIGFTHPTGTGALCGQAIDINGACFGVPEDASVVQIDIADDVGLAFLVTYTFSKGHIRLTEGSFCGFHATVPLLDAASTLELRFSSGACAPVAAGHGTVTVTFEV